MLLDHVFVLVFAVIYPVAGFFSFRRLLRRIEQGRPVSRGRLYAATIAGQWLLCCIGLCLWLYREREFALLGFDPGGGAWFWLAAALTLAGIILLIGQLRTVRRADRELLDRIHSSFGALEHLMPHNGGELARFSLLAITAGIVEEILWRGYLIWYLDLHMPLWAAALASTVGFGVAHAYQGRDSVVKITAVGAVFTVIYLLSGSLLLPIVLHAAVDLLQGRLAYDVIRRRGVHGAD